ncbi:hypothetical protein AVEN_160300-1 [Araneus ventricosus]|uniref:Uncharacterized protein n=1 Tax=Araneus ventricosus TaxID=182803 RepID=A0A4Y2L7E9_ARAVE|nr:hypothetical protein AVEN_160300-1 [Araneus ventricosus]
MESPYLSLTFKETWKQRTPITTPDSSIQLENPRGRLENHSGFFDPDNLCFSGGDFVQSSPFTPKQKDAACDSHVVFGWVVSCNKTTTLSFHSSYLLLPFATNTIDFSFLYIIIVISLYVLLSKSYCVIPVCSLRSVSDYVLRFKKITNTSQEIYVT